MKPSVPEQHLKSTYHKNSCVCNRGSQVVLEMKINLASGDFAEEGEFACRSGTFKLSDANVMLNSSKVVLLCNF